MKRSPLALNRPLVRLAAFAFISLFIAAPTPGNVGGCGGNQAGTRIVAADGHSEEFVFFDTGLCAHFCERLLECGALCPAIGLPGGCDQGPSLNSSFVRCVRGSNLNPAFFGGATSCPHACPGNTRFTLAYEWDAQACGDSVIARQCTDFSPDSPNGIGNTFSNASSECLNDTICQPR